MRTCSTARTSAQLCGDLSVTLKKVDTGKRITDSFAVQQTLTQHCKETVFQ